jgi:Tripartite tricarboxylate transporter family receptor
MEFERIFLGTALAASVGVTDTTFGQAEQYPSKLVRVALPYTAGSPNDVVARHSVLHLSIRLGQSVIVNNRLGGSTSIGSKSVTTSRPDGYTLLFSNDGTHYVASLGNKERLLSHRGLHSHCNEYQKFSDTARRAERARELGVGIGQLRVSQSGQAEHELRLGKVDAPAQRGVKAGHRE